MYIKIKQNTYGSTIANRSLSWRYLFYIFSQDLKFNIKIKRYFLITLVNEIPCPYIQKNRPRTIWTKSKWTGIAYGALSIKIPESSNVQNYIRNDDTYNKIQ